ncbi:MAG: orotidine-5'-phosphate decarboxylase, partial [Alphaproteobacteria bacterium]|nr:orotidine-5'-phosphate decarboxylase [Alphaproteobacteria bacterium]
AIDTPELDLARALSQSLAGAVGGIKLGLEFFNAHGPAGVTQVAGNRGDLFLDLKYHDIPNTVAGAVRAAVKLQPMILNVHAGGGPAMMRAALEAAEEGSDRLGIARPKIIAVTVLTSMDDGDLDAVGQKGPSTDQVVRLARLTQDCGLAGVVCSPREIAAIRDACGPDFTLVVPGIRPAGAAVGDQKRVMTPRQAIDAGADWLVIGRPITGAPDPAAAARNILRELA